MKHKDIELKNLIEVPGGYLDKETGELIENAKARLITEKQKFKFEGSHSAMSNQVLGRVMREAKLTAFEYDIFFTLVEYMEFGGTIELTQKEVSEIAGVDKAQVSRAFKKLSEKGIIYVKRMIGKRSKIYALNPNLIYMGSAQNHGKAIKEHHSILAQHQKASVVSIKRNEKIAI